MLDQEDHPCLGCGYLKIKMWSTICIMVCPNGTAVVTEQPAIAFICGKNLTAADIMAAEARMAYAENGTEEEPIDAWNWVIGAMEREELQRPQ